VPGVDRRAVRGRLVGGVDQVLDPDGDPVERAERLLRVAVARLLVALPGLREGLLGVEVGPGVQLVLALGDELEARGHDLLAGGRTGADGGRGRQRRPRRGGGAVPAHAVRAVASRPRRSRLAPSAAAGREPTDDDPDERDQRAERERAEQVGRTSGRGGSGRGRTGEDLSDRGAPTPGAGSPTPGTPATGAPASAGSGAATGGPCTTSWPTAPKNSSAVRRAAAPIMRWPTPPIMPPTTASAS
jgi:hypothetical protein